MKDYVLDEIRDSELIETPIFKNETVKVAVDANIARLSKSISAFDRLLEISKTKFEIKLSTKAELFLLLSSPNYCNAIVSVCYRDPETSTSFNTEFSEFKEIEEFLHFLVTEYVKYKETTIKKEE